MNKTALKNFAVWARKKLISDITDSAGFLAVTENGIGEPLPQSTKDLQLFDIGTKDYVEVKGIRISQRNSLVSAIRAKTAELNGNHKAAFQYVVEEVAYTWFNRMIAIRFMEVNDYLPIRVLSSESGKHEPDIVTSPFEAELDFTNEESDHIYTLRDTNKLEELFRMLFIKECNKLHEVLPELFEATNDYTEPLLSLSFTDEDSVVYHLVNDIPEEYFDVNAVDDDGNPIGQVQIIGWLYQYYNSEPKNKVFAALKKNVKISKENIPSATQLFTPDWIVRYMVENSLGRLWVDGHSDFDKSEWKYFLEEAEQEESVKAQLNELRAESKNLNPEDIRFIDPCMGSGHILVYAFDVLMQIYLSQGYTERDAASLIIEKNLYGADIDKRAYQLSYFALMMKGRAYDRRFLTRNVKPNLCNFQEIAEINPDNLTGELGLFARQFANCDTYGSLIEVKPFDTEKLSALIEDYEENLETLGYRDILEKMLVAYRIFAQKYDVCCTNPPYIGGSGMNSVLSDFIKKNFEDYKSDLFSASIVRCTKLTKPCGYLGFLSPYVWMFIQSYEKLRNYFYSSKTIETLIQFEYSAFEEATVPICTFVLKNSRVKKNGVYLRLTDFKGGMEVQRLKTLEAIADHNCGFYYEANSENFSKIPGSPVAYWVSENFLKQIETALPLKEISKPKTGMRTGDNERFLRIWYEVEYSRVGISMRNAIDAQSSKCKWFPYNKGGDFQLWYGNNMLVVNWENDGKEIKDNTRKVYPQLGDNLSWKITNEQDYFRSGITWTVLTSGKNSFRFSDCGFIFDSNKGPMLFPDEDKMMFLLGLLNSTISSYYLNIINPSLSLQNGDMEKFPVIFDDTYIERINNLVKDSIADVRADWDSFETSWDFAEHPLVRLQKGLWDATAIGAAMQAYYGEHIKVSCPVELCYMLWQGECNRRFNQLKANEEELNRIFIDIYGLQDELTPEVEEKDVTVRRADLTRDIKSLISYAVGCMLGRYSLNVDGLAYAGGEWDDSKYRTFIPDDDNCIPITDEEYFKDDIVVRFVEFIRIVYGADSLEQNLNYIADALGTKGNTSRERIRSYFLGDFIKDHIKTYQKRPIYWLFDSGKQNGFKALVYMHRWNADTTGNVRVEYLHKLQRMYENEIRQAQDIVDDGGSAREVSAAQKRIEKLTKQLKETRDYDEKIAHLAVSRIDIDLDDGVKVNYEKVQTGVDGKKIEILTKI